MNILKKKKILILDYPPKKKRSDLKRAKPTIKQGAIVITKHPENPKKPNENNLYKFVPRNNNF
jgi:hypothetical protein